MNRLIKSIQDFKIEATGGFAIYVILSVGYVTALNIVTILNYIKGFF